MKDKKIKLSNGKGYIELAEFNKPKRNIEKDLRIEIIDRDSKISLRELIEKMDFLTKKGFECWFEGLGDGSVKILFERRRNANNRKR